MTVERVREKERLKIECSEHPIKPCNCLECDLHEIDFVPEEDTYHGCNHPSAIGMFLTSWDNNHFPDWCPRGYVMNKKRESEK